MMTNDIGNFIDGETAAPVGGGYLDNVDPSTGKVYGRVPDSDERDVEMAVAAAARAFPAWSRMPAEQRCRILLKLANMLETQIDRFATAECVDNGKPLSLATELDIPRSVKNLRFFATAVVHAQSESHAMESAINYTLRKPRGVAGVISPWNLPLYVLTWKIAPALATGNTVVAKPSELTPMTAYLLGELCREASLPPGVLNIVHGLGAKAGAAIVRHPRVVTVSFTGGTVTGAEVAKTAAPLFKKVALELGGKNPNIIFGDADMDAAIDTSLRSSFANQGQVCLCGSRILVQQDAFESFVGRFVDRTGKLRVGDPLDAATDQGAVVSKAHLEKIERYVQLARDDGGEVLCGGRRPGALPTRCSGGYFYEPTVITNLDVRCRVNREEIFGPVVTITPFATESQVIDYANDTPYGLCATVWTRDLSRAHRLSDRLDVGTVWINCWMVRDLRVPFGGMKSSGVGREGGLEALRFYAEPKNVCIRIPDSSCRNDPT